MPTIPIRGVGAVGIISDQNPQDAPLSAWTDACNVRFANDILSRYSVFRKVKEDYAYSKVPVGVLDGYATGDGYLVTVFSDGSMEQLSNGVTTSVTPAGTLGPSTNQITTTTLGGITYLNREADVPIYRENPGDVTFAAIPGWSSTDRCKSMRSYKDFLIALNVTKPTGQYDAMVKWSDAAQFGAPPANWDVTLESSLAGETVLNDINGVLLDGVSLGDSFILYGNKQTYRMDFIGAPFVFRFQKVFDDQGVIAQNCAVEADGRHYVFGSSDLYIHDGITKTSIATDRVVRRVFTELLVDQSEKCFVFHDRLRSEVGFAYPSNSDTAAWNSGVTNGCNRAAVYNYRYQTWTFIDLPAVVGGASVSLTQSLTWESFAAWNAASVTWASTDGSKPRCLVLCSLGNSLIGKAAQSYFLDGLSDPLLPNPADPDLLWPAFAEMLRRDSDELGAELYGRKLLRQFILQFRTSVDTDKVTFNVGQCSSPAADVKWGNPKTFTRLMDPKYDTRINGRYLSIRIDIPAGSYAEVSGYDADLTIIAGR